MNNIHYVNGDMMKQYIEVEKVDIIRLSAYALALSLLSLSIALISVVVLTYGIPNETAGHIPALNKVNPFFILLAIVMNGILSTGVIILSFFNPKIPTYKVRYEIKQGGN